MELNYPQYLKLDQLLSLQEPRSKPEEHDEMLFIVIHQEIGRASCRERV